MSRITKKRIYIPSNIFINISKKKIFVKGILGLLSILYNGKIKIKLNNRRQIICIPKINNRYIVSICYTIHSLINNMIQGVSNGFKKKLLLVGIGYKAQIIKNMLNLYLGFSKNILYKVPSVIRINIEKQTEIIINGIDKQIVGMVASEIRSKRPPEVYKGKGIKYIKEIIKFKNTKKNK